MKRVKKKLIEIAENVEKVYNAGVNSGTGGGTTLEEYELIEEITLSENTSKVIFSNINLKRFYIGIVGGFVDGVTSTLYMKINDYDVMGNASVQLPASLEKGCYVRFIRESDGICRVQATKALSGNLKPFNTQSSMALDNIYPPSAKNYESIYPVNKIELYTGTGTAKQWLNGSSFKLYGIKAEVTQ